MSRFITPLSITQLDKKLWQIEAALMFMTSLIGRVIAVPAGFITDLASVPRIPLVYLMAGGKASAPAVVHDWLYSTHEVDRETADAIFHEAILAQGHHSRFTAWLMWASVRAGGWVSWDKPNLKQPAHIDLPG